MPWLVGTALIHSLAVTEKRGALQQLDGAARDRRVLAVAARHLPRALGRAHLGARVRHRPDARHLHPRLPRARDRRRRSRSTPGARRASASAAASRRSRARSLLLANNVLLVVAAGAVLLGTLYPLLLDALGLGKISVGPPYFETVFVPLMAPALFLMGVGPLARWKQRQPARARGAAALGARREPRRRPAAAASPSASGTRWSASASRSPLWVVAHRASCSYARSARKRTRARICGMVVAHLGVAVFVVGVTLVKGYESEQRRAHAARATRSTLGGYVFRLDGVDDGARPELRRGARRRSRSRATASRSPMLYPEKRIYTVQSRSMTEAAIDPGPDARPLRLARRAARRAAPGSCAC